MGARLTKSLEIYSSVELCDGRAHYAKGVKRLLHNVSL